MISKQRGMEPEEHQNGMYVARVELTSSDTWKGGILCHAAINILAANVHILPFRVNLSMQVTRKESSKTRFPYIALRSLAG